MKQCVFFVEFQLTIEQWKFIIYCMFLIVSSIFFFAQLQQIDCFFFVIVEDFFIDINDIHVTKQQDFYVLQFDKFVICLTINFDTLQMWHERFDYVDKVNICYDFIEHELKIFTKVDLWNKKRQTRQNHSWTNSMNQMNF